MRHFMQLHLVDRYGEPKREPNGDFVVHSNKAAEILRATTGIIWLVALERRPTRYSIAWRYQAMGFFGNLHPDFQVCVLGQEGKEFAPRLPLTEEAYHKLSAATGRFRHGFSKLDAASVGELERIVVGDSDTVRLVPSGSPSSQNS
jgi:hypothetical protein